MTEYERLSLKLLSFIAGGLALQVGQAGMNGEPLLQVRKEVLEWTKKLPVLLEAVHKATGPDATKEAQA